MSVQPSLTSRTRAVIENPDTLQTILDNTSNGGSLIDLCQMWNVRYSDIFRWIYEDEKRRAAYNAAERARGEWFIQRVLKEIRDLGVVNIKDIFDDHGNLKDLKDIPTATAAAISYVETFEEYSAGKNPEYLGRTRKIRLNDKLKALELIGKNFFMFVDVRRVEGDVAIVHKVDQVDLDERIRQITHATVTTIEADRIKDESNP